MSGTSSDESDIQLEEEEVDEVEESEDEDDEEDVEDVEEEDEGVKVTPKIPFNTPKNSTAAKFEAKKGKILYVRFPNKLTEDLDELTKEVKSLCKFIVKVHRPRQSWAHFCNVEFDSEEKRDKGMKILQDVVLADDKKLLVKLPFTEDDDFVERVLELKAKKLQNKKTKTKLKRLAKQKSKTFTSILSITNIPFTATQDDIKKFFPNAIDIRYTYPKDSESTSKALITLPTPRDATTSRSQKIEVGGNALRIGFAGGYTNKRNKKKEAKGEPLTKGRKPLPSKRKSSDANTENGSPSKKPKKNKKKKGPAVAAAAPTPAVDANQPEKVVSASPKKSNDIKTKPKAKIVKTVKNTNGVNKKVEPVAKNNPTKPVAGKKPNANKVKKAVTTNKAVIQKKGKKNTTALKTASK